MNEKELKLKCIPKCKCYCSLKQLFKFIKK